MKTTNEKTTQTINEKDLTFKFNLLATIASMKKTEIIKHFEDLAENRNELAYTYQISAMACKTKSLKEIVEMLKLEQQDGKTIILGKTDKTMFLSNKKSISWMFRNLVKGNIAETRIKQIKEVATIINESFTMLCERYLEVLKEHYNK